MARSTKSRPADVVPQPQGESISPGPSKTLAGLRVPKPESRLVFLPPDWLPLALIAGDAGTAVAGVLLRYWERHTLHPTCPQGAGGLAFGPHPVAIPVGITLFWLALSPQRPYH